MVEIVDLAITDVQVFDGSSEALRPGPVNIAGEQVVSVGENRPARRYLDGRSGTVVPGFIDAHFHAYGTSPDLHEIHSVDLSYVALAGARRLTAALQRGFTTVRDVAGGDAGFAAGIKGGLFRSPRYLFTGPALSQTGGHGDGTAAGRHACGCGAYLSEVVDGVDDLRRKVRERFRNGAHAIKIMTSGGVVSPSDPLRLPQYSAEEIRAVVDEARRRDSYVAAHAYSPEAIMHALTNGVHSIEHGNLLDAATAEAMVRHGAFLVPTLAAYRAIHEKGAAIGMSEVARSKNLEVLEAGQTALLLAQEAGVRIGWGSDLMGSLESEQLSGIRLHSQVVGPLETLRSLTSVNADLIGRDDLGCVRPGAVADLLVLAGNPLDDASLLWAESPSRTVVQRGEVVAGRSTREPAS